MNYTYIQSFYDGRYSIVYLELHLRLIYFVKYYGIGIRANSLLLKVEMRHICSIKNKIM